jgi:uncharacterized protein with NAD-binding domain and iron-sulfur cluster
MTKPEGEVDEKAATLRSRSKEARTTVAVFGAGISGLTAAHELVERGYLVEVYECAPPSLLEEECSIGGMARTQWARDERDPHTFFKDTRALQPTRPIDWRIERALGRRIYFNENTTEPTTTAAPGHQSGREVLDELIAALTAKEAWPLYEDITFEVRGFMEELGEVPHRSAGRKDYDRAAYVIQELEAALPGGFEDRFRTIGFGLGCAENWALPRGERAYVEIHPFQEYVPGEHGYRFFPTFYRNLRDTLRRTPIAEDRENFVETSRSVFDNLVPTTSQGVNFESDPTADPPENKRPYVLPRRRIPSAQVFFDLLVESLCKSDLSLQDTNRLAARTFKFMTSCRERREKEYETLSWWDFIGGDDYSPKFQHYLDRVAQAFVAMTAKECDARTYGDISLQLYRDQFFEADVTDPVLNGPTSLAWFHIWRRYLESQGVKFIRGKLIDFEVFDEEVAWPVVVLADEIEKQSAGNPYKRVLVQTSYTVLALNIEAMQELLRNTTGGKKLQGEDFRLLRDLELGDASAEKPDGVLRHLTGMQFYFPSDIKFLPGHTVFPDSEWGLSSIYQPQFWLRKRGWWDGYRGVLSVCIGKWHGVEGDKLHAPWHCTPEEIARQVWEQIRRGIPQPERDRTPDPTLFHIDDNMIFGQRDGPGTPPRPIRNESRMFVNIPGTQSRRPGRLSTSAETKLDGYRVWCANIVLAGTYMQTFTRLTTMEAANESGRHAVNGILAHDGRTGCFKGDRCDIYNPEDCEFEDLAYFIDLDRELLKQGLPHFADILDLKKVTKALLRGELPSFPEPGE